MVLHHQVGERLVPGRQVREVHRQRGRAARHHLAQRRDIVGRALRVRLAAGAGCDAGGLPRAISQPEVVEKVQDALADALAHLIGDRPRRHDPSKRRAGTTQRAAASMLCTDRDL